MEIERGFSLHTVTFSQNRQTARELFTIFCIMTNITHEDMLVAHITPECYISSLRVRISTYEFWGSTNVQSIAI